MKKCKTKYKKAASGLQEVVVPPQGDPMDALSSGMSMASTGASVGGPWGAAIGGAIGLGVGIKNMITANKESAAAAEHNKIARLNNKYAGTDETQAQRFLAKKGGNISATKPVEAEKNELVFKKVGNRFKLKADFKEGKTHAQGGVKFTAEQGDIIFPGKSRSKVMQAYEDGNHLLLESMRMTLPEDDETGMYPKGNRGLKTGSDGIPAAKDIANGIGDWWNSLDIAGNLRVPAMTQGIPIANMGLESGGSSGEWSEATPKRAIGASGDWSTPAANGLSTKGWPNGSGPTDTKKTTTSTKKVKPTFTPGTSDEEFTFSDDPAVQGNSLDTMKKIVGDTAPNTALAGGPSVPKEGQAPGAAKGDFDFNNVLGYAGIVNNALQALSPAEKVEENYVDPKLLKYKDSSDPLRRKSKSIANIDTANARNLSGGSTGNVRANANQAQANDFLRQQDIDNAEVGRAGAVDNANVEIKNRAKEINAQKRDMYGEQNAQNRAARNAYRDAATADAGYAAQVKARDNKAYAMDQTRLDATNTLFNYGATIDDNGNLVINHNPNGMTGEMMNPTSDTTTVTNSKGETTTKVSKPSRWGQFRRRPNGYK